MLHISGYLNDFDEERIDTRETLSVHSCGHYRLIKAREFTTTYPEGRQDYQLLYVRDGCIRVSLKKKEYMVKAGGFIVYHPGERQQYTYLNEENPDVYWVHFSGTQVPEVLEQLGLYSPQIHTSIHWDGCSELFDSLIQELQRKREHFAPLCNLLFRQLLLLLSRNIKEQKQHSPGNQQLIESSLAYFHESYHQPVSISEYAKSLNISCCWFIRCFKEFTGVTPGQYLLELRMNKARELLQNGTFNVSETAAFVGYDNPLYFSRLFRRHFGAPPKNYLPRKAEVRLRM